MSVIAIEGVIDHGVVRLTSDAALPEGTRVYVIVPDAMLVRAAHLPSPRLARREDAADFAMSIIE